jgi:CHAT domain-containing protein
MLARYRILHFATQGPVGGDVADIAKKLSACNIAAGDGLGVEALSGLARAFFYAGSKSLLVSHCRSTRKPPCVA